MKALLMVITFIMQDGTIGFQWLKAPVGETFEHCKTVSSPVMKKELLDRQIFLDIDTHCVMLKIPTPEKKEEVEEEKEPDTENSQAAINTLEKK